MSNRRAKHPLPYALLSLRWNIKTGLYEITQEGITYGMNMETVVLLKKWFRDHLKDHPTMKGWYSSLKNEVKKKVVRIGELENYLKDFFPDASFGG